MSKLKLKIIFINVILLTQISFMVIVGDTKADIVLTRDTGTGNFLPEEDSNLSMTNANVIFNIDATNYQERINIDFQGNYTIYNPYEAVNVTLIAPFSIDFIGLESSCLIKVEDVIIPHSYIEYNISGYYWDEYLDFYHFGIRKFIITNISLPENDSITLEYSFNAYLSTIYSKNIEQINYDVGTSRAWNGTITERVEFKVLGKVPDSYSTYLYNCTVTDSEDGKIYLWEWINEQINVNGVYISYYFSHHGPHLLVIIFPLMYVLAVVVVVIVAVKMSAKKPKGIDSYPTPKNKYCTHCGALLVFESKFCTNCGAEILEK